MSQKPNKEQNYGFRGGFTVGFMPAARIKEPKNEFYDFNVGGEYPLHWQDVQQQVNQQQQQQPQKTTSQHLQTMQTKQMHQRQSQTYQFRQQPQNPNDINLAMDVNMLTPTIEMDELIIKTEPPDDTAVLDTGDDSNTNAFSCSSTASLHKTLPYQRIKEEPSASQQKSPNFPRRKVQTERSETLPICQRCKQVFLKKSSYIKHVRQSSCSILEYNFRCIICPMSFMSPEELQAHESVHRANQFFCQKYCGKYFDTLDLCEAHEFTFHEFEVFGCNVCAATYKTREGLFAHKTQHRHLIRFDCSICRRWFTSPSELRRHCIESPFLCGKFFSADKSSHHNEPYFSNNSAMNESNYSLQDCNIGVIEVAPNTSLINANSTQRAPGNIHFSTGMAIKTESTYESPIYGAEPFDSSLFYNNTYTVPPPPYNNSYSSSPYNELHSPFQIMEQRYSNNFSFSSPYSPATPAVQEGDAVCCVPQCGLRKSTSPTLQFFKYPKDVKYLKQWLHNMKLIYNPSESYEDYRICSLHFPKRVINLHSLCYWAVPTYHLGHEDTANIYHNRDQSYYVQSKCSMPGCNSHRGKTNLKFYNFPTTDVDTYMKWCENARLPLKAAANEYRQLCSRHFEDHCFGKIRLKVWAVPTLHLGGNPLIHCNPQVPTLEVKKCCLPNCRRKRSEDPSLSLYSFPRDESLLQRWCYNLKLDPMEYRGKFHKICSAHFVKDVIGTMRLHTGAVPTLNLGHNDPNIYTNEITHNQLTTSSSSSKNTFHSNSSSSSSSAASSTTNYETPDTCSLPSCKRNRYADNVSMHMMPGRSEMLQKWCHNIKMDSKKITKHFRICSIHFEPYCIGGCMRPFAVPTLHLGHDDPNIYRNPKVIKKLHLRETCCVPTCRRNRDRHKANLHRFPLRKPEMLKKWLDNLRRPMPDGTRLFNDAICERHFEERCIRSKRLERWAVPTLELGHDEEITPLPSEAEIGELYFKQVSDNSTNNSLLATGECCVPSCQRSPKTDDIKLYTIPVGEDMLNKWSHNLQQDLRSMPAALICNLHFETRCIGKRLHSWAVPTLNLPPSATSTLYENPKDESKAKSVTCAPRCCLPHCRKQRCGGKVQLFRFPSYSKSMLKKWCHNLQISPAVASSSHRRVCSVHFEPHVLTKRCPMPNSMPTLELNCPPGYKIYQNPERLKLAKLRTEGLCVIPSCRKSKVDGVQLFLYPNGRGLLRKWAYNTKQKAGECIRGQLRICSEHFESNCFGPVRLCPGAIPTLKLGHDDPDIFPNDLPRLEEQEMQCVVDDCKRSRAVDGVKLFRFPYDDENLFLKWCSNLKLTSADCQKSRLCNLHFEAACVGPRGLFRWAIPTLLLGHHDTELQLYLNPKPEERVNAELNYKCCVALCGRTRKFDDAQLNGFPKNRERFNRWAHNLRLDLDFSEREKYRICNAHFESQCLGKNRLNLGAIPTLQLGHNSDDIFQLEASEVQPWYMTNKRQRLNTTNELQTEMSDETEETKCSYPDCMATKSALRESYAMPKHAALLELWCHVLKIDKKSLSAEAKLCGLHFIEVYEETKAALSSLLKAHADINSELQVLTASYEHCIGSSLMRSMKCSVQNCKTTSLSGEGIKLFQFPYNRDLCEKWCFNTSVKLDEQRRHLYKVCTKHFEPHCLSDAQRLRPWAIPTLHLPPLQEALHQNPDLAGMGRRQLGTQSSKCCLPSCNTTLDTDAVRLFNFPTDSEIVTKWLHNLRQCVERDKCPLYKICALHFEQKCVSKMGRLRPWAIPTLKLGQNNADEEGEFQLYRNPNDLTSTEPKVSDHSEAQSSGCKIKHTLDLVKCCVASCRKSRLQHGVRFFDFPTEPKLFKRWCFNLQLPPATPKSLQKICNQHFEKRCFVDNKQLHTWALPTLNLDQNLDLDRYKNPRRDFVKQHFKRIRRTRYLPQCCVPGCGKRRTIDNHLRTFALPTEEKVLQAWCEILKIKPEALYKNSRICEAHFAEEDRFKTKLKPGVLPTIHLSSDHAVNIVRSMTPHSPNTPTSPNHSADPNTLADPNTPAGRKTLADQKTPTHSNCPASPNLVDLNTCVSPNKPINSTCPSSEQDLRDVIKMPSLNNPPSLQPRKARRCCIHTCLNHKLPLSVGIHLFPFPRPSQLLLRKWCHNTQQVFQKRLGLNICPLHFETEALSHGKPRPWAIPTLDLGHQQPIYQNPVIAVEREKCCIANCSATTPVPLFGFPKRSTLLRKWAHNTKRDTYLALRRNYKVCSRHFEANCITPEGTLNFGAIPTLNLGHDGEDNYANEAVTARYQCSIAACGRSTFDDGVKLFEFPADDVGLLEKWCHNLKIERDDCTKLRICNLHFMEGCVGKNKLIAGAVPTIMLGHHDHTLQLQKPELSAAKSTNNNTPVIICCVPNCGRNRLSDDVHMISFPKNNTLYLKWIHNLKLGSATKLRHRGKVCSAHFEDDCMQGFRIKLGSIPTLNLGHTDPDIHVNNFRSLKVDTTDAISVPFCSLSECHDLKQLQTQLFDVPQDDRIRQRWTEDGLQAPLLGVNAKLCPLHFMIGYESQSQQLDYAENSDENIRLAETYKSISNSSRWRIFLCCVKGCHTKIINSKNIKLFKLPQNAEMYSKWCHNIGLQIDEHRRYSSYRVCALHFEARCLGAIRLRPWALPTLKLNKADKTDILQIPENETETESPEFLESQSVCCVKNCISFNSNPDGNHRLYKFPSDPNIFQRWCHNLSLESGSNNADEKICSAHFESYCFDKQKLRLWAMPTLQLNILETNLYHNPEVKNMPSEIQRQICCVFDCRQQRDDNAGIKLFKFPLKPDLLKKWLNNLKLTVDDCTNLRICSLHFEPRCCKKSRLFSWALPTLNLGHDDHSSILQNPKGLQKLKCCLPHCRKSRRNDTTLRLYRFPRTEDTCNQWLHNLKLTNEQLECQSISKHKICNDHFEERCFSRNTLHDWSIPTLNLGHNEHIFNNPQQQEKKEQQDHSVVDDDSDNLQQCCVPACESLTSYQDLFGFPQCLNLLQKWCDNIKIPDAAQYRRTKCRICAKHFPNLAFRNNTYLPGVVPTLLLGYDEAPQHQNPNNLGKYHSCSLEHVCRQQNPGEPLKLFSCPKSDATLWLQWCANLCLNAAQESAFNMLCNAHFSTELIVGNKLKPGAVPTLQLGHEQPPIYTNSPETVDMDSSLMCVVIDCMQAGDSKLFDIPTESMLLAKWCANLKQEPQHLKGKKICSQHFAINDIEKCLSLPQNALPTLHLGHREQPAYDAVVLRSPAQKKRNRAIKCCVSSCPRAGDKHSSNTQFYRFPKINWLLRKWCYNLRLAATGDVENRRICSDHFERHCVGQTKLRPWALPTLALGHKQHIYTSVKLRKYHAEEKACGEIQFVRNNYCAIVSCLKSREDGVQLFRYPRNATLLRKWAENCKHKMYQAARYAFRICTAHFDEICLMGGGMRLRPGAIPTLQLGHNDENIHQHGLEVHLNCTTPITPADSEQECCVPGCGLTKLSENVRFFAFPKDAEMLEAWCHNLKIAPNECMNANKRICNKHFEERCLSLRNLRPRIRALPTLRLGHSDTADIIPNPATFERPEQIIHCCVPQCGKSKQSDGVLLHCFPKNRKMFCYWTNNLKLNLKYSTEGSFINRVCSEHFEDFCYGPGRRLLFGAIPTLKLGHNDVDCIHPVKQDMISSLHERRKRKKTRGKKSEEKCCVTGCQHSSRYINVYGMPKNPLVQALWLKSLEMEPVDNAAKLCMLHFKMVYDKSYDQMLELCSTVDDSTGALQSELSHLTSINTEILNSTRMRSMHCSVPGCKGNTLAGEVKLYSFPYNRDLFDKWCHNTQIQVTDYQRSLYRVCTLHFEPHALIESSKRLRPWALPTLNLPPHTPPSDIIPNPDLTTLETRSLGHVADKLCCIPSCVHAQQASGAVFYRFPRDDAQLFDKWLHNSQLKPNEAVYARICNRHFEPHCIGKRLRSWAIPTLHLGHEKTDIYKNPAEKMEEVITLMEKKQLNKMQTNTHVADGKPIKNEFKSKATKFERNDKQTDIDEGTYSKKKFKLAKKFEALSLNTTLIEASIKDEEWKKQEIKNFKWMPRQEVRQKLTHDIQPLNCSENSVENPEQSNNGTDDLHSPIAYAENSWQHLDQNEILDSSEDYNNMNKFKITLIEKDRDVSEDTSYEEENSAQKGGSLQCRIANCSSRLGQSNIVLHKMPKNATIRKRWLHNTQIEYDASRPWAYKICNLHFTRTSYSGPRLMQWAVPTLHLGPNRPATIYADLAPGKKLKRRRQRLKKIVDEEPDESLTDEEPGKNFADEELRQELVPRENVEQQVQSPPSFNFKITSIESINFDSSLNDDGVCGDSFSSIEPNTRVRRSVLACSLPTCHRRFNEDFVMLHLLPKDPLLRHKWCFNCRLRPLQHELITTRVCSLHFEQHCFTIARRQLKLGSIPTLYLGHNDRNIYRNARTLCESIACCVPGCGRRRKQDQARHFRFPSDKRMLSKWLFNLQLEFNASRPWIYNVCEMHFEPHCFGKVGNLHSWAVPTLKLGNTQPRDLRLNEQPPAVESDEIDDDNDDFDDDALLIPPECSISESEVNSSQLYSSQMGETEQTVADYIKCHLPRCGRTRANDYEVRLFSFPKDDGLRQKWLFNTKINYKCDDAELNMIKICDLHFERRMLGLNNDVLKQTAVPTLNLGHNDSNIYQNTTEDPPILEITHAISASELMEQMPSIKLEPLDTTFDDDVSLVSPRMMGESSPCSSNQPELTKFCYNKRCFLEHCKLRRGDGVKLFRFPLKTEMQLMWEHNLKLDYDSRRHHRNFLCSKHFEPELIGRKFLLRGAIPTLNLGHNDLANIYRPSLSSTMANQSSAHASASSLHASYTSEQHRQVLSCSVPGCCSRDTGSDDVLLFALPQEQRYAKIWKQRLRLDETKGELRVCSLHFGRNCISRRNLAPRAVPTLHLPPSPTAANKAKPKEEPKILLPDDAATPHTCSVPCCPNAHSRSEKIKIFTKFPEDFELFTKWCFNLKIDPRKYVDGSYGVCSIHFEPYCIGGHSLRIWAVPTLSLGHNDPNIHEVIRPAEMELKCCLPHCGRRRSTDDVLFFNFPKGDLYKTWCKILQIDELLYRNTDKKICSIHFSSDCFNGSMLRAGVKPTLYLKATIDKISAANSSSRRCRSSNRTSSGPSAGALETIDCIVQNCTASETAASPPLLFSFPENRKLRKKWLHNLKLPTPPPESPCKICYKHFETNSINNGKLHAEAVPTLALGHDDDDIFINTGSFTTVINHDNSLLSSPPPPPSTSSLSANHLPGITNCSDTQLSDSHEFNDFCVTFVKQEPLEDEQVDDGLTGDDDAVMIGDLLTRMLEDEY